MGTRDALLIAFSLLGVVVLIGEFLIAKVRTARGPHASAVSAMTPTDPDRPLVILVFCVAVAIILVVIVALLASHNYLATR